MKFGSCLNMFLLASLSSTDIFYLLFLIVLTVWKWSESPHHFSLSLPNCFTSSFKIMSFLKHVILLTTLYILSTKLPNSVLLMNCTTQFINHYDFNICRWPSNILASQCFDFSGQTSFSSSLSFPNLHSVISFIDSYVYSAISLRSIYWPCHFFFFTIHSSVLSLYFLSYPVQISWSKTTMTSLQKASFDLT